jgi:hypothetical protein
MRETPTEETQAHAPREDRATHEQHDGEA